MGYSWSTLPWYQWYYPHRLRDALSPVCDFFFGGGTNERPGTDHVTSGPMRGLGKKLHPMAQNQSTTDPHTHGHGDSMTEWAQWGQFSKNKLTSKNLKFSQLCFLSGWFGHASIEPFFYSIACKKQLKLFFPRQCGFQSRKGLNIWTLFYTLNTKQFTLHKWHFKNFTLYTSNSKLPTPHNALHTSHFTIHFTE